MRNRALEASPAALVKNYLIYSLFSAVFGVGISFLAVLGQDGSVISRALPSGAIIGITISTVIFALELGVVGWLDDLVSVPRLVFRIPHYLVGGMLGFILGERLSGWIFGIDIVPDGGLRLWLPFICIFSLQKRESTAPRSATKASRLFCREPTRQPPAGSRPSSAR